MVAVVLVGLLELLALVREMAQTQAPHQVLGEQAALEVLEHHGVVLLVRDLLGILRRTHRQRHPPLQQAVRLFRCAPYSKGTS